jgi:hypothetical protein
MLIYLYNDYVFIILVLLQLMSQAYTNYLLTQLC